MVCKIEQRLVDIEYNQGKCSHVVGLLGLLCPAGRVRPSWIALTSSPATFSSALEPAEKSRGSLSAGALAIPEHTPVTIPLSAACLSPSRYGFVHAPRAASGMRHDHLPAGVADAHMRSRGIE